MRSLRNHKTRLTHQENEMSHTNPNPPSKPRAAPQQTQLLFIEVDPLVRATQQAPQSRACLNRHVQLRRFQNLPRRKRATPKSSANKKPTPNGLSPSRGENRANAVGPEQGQCECFSVTGSCTGSSVVAPEGVPVQRMSRKLSIRYAIFAGGPYPRAQERAFQRLA